MINTACSWIYTFAVLWLMSVAITGCDSLSTDSSKGKHFEAGQAYFSKAKYAEALIEFKNAAKLDPDNADAHYRLALTHLKLGGKTNLQGAFTELSRTTELDKSNHDARLKLGELYLLGNEPAKARVQADLVLGSTPENAEGLILRGRSLIYEKQYLEGMAELKKAIDLDPKNSIVYIDLARAYLSQNNHTAAENTLKEALTVSPRAIEIMLALGDFYLTTGNQDKAEATYKDAIETAPQKDEIYLRLAAFYQRHNRLDEAQAALVKLATLKPHEESPQIYLGDFFLWAGQADKALASYQRAAELNPQSTIAQQKLISHYLDTGKVTEADVKTKEILDKNPSALLGRFFNARLKLAKGNADEAIALLQDVVKDEPQLALAHHFLGIAYWKQHKTAQARAAFADAIKINPISSESHTALAEVLLAEGSTDMALEEAQAAIQLNSRSLQAAIIIGDAYLRKGELRKSRQVYEAIARALPTDSLAPYRLGLVARAEKNEAKALAYFEDALAKQPAFIEPVAQIVMINVAQGNSQEARERVQRQLDVSPNPLLYNILGELWMNAKDGNRAETAFKKAIDLDRTFLPAYMGLGQVHFQAGQTDRAVKEYEAVLIKEPQAVQAHMMLGIIHASRKQYIEAQAHYESVLGINPKFAPASNNLAWLILEHGGNLDVAFSHAQTARAQKPDDPYIADTMGWLYYKKNAFLSAINLLREAAEKLPNEPIVHYHLGMALHKKGDVAEAKKSLQTSVKISQNFPGVEEARKILSEL